MGVLVNIGRAQSQISLYGAYFAAVVFAIVVPVFVWKGWATRPKPKQPVWKPVAVTVAVLAVSATIVVGARWWNAKVQSSNGWATFQGASTVSGMAGGLFRD
jgi:hypothetical protein